MSFKRVTNRKTGSVRYYIDGVRVSHHTFDLKTDYSKFSCASAWHTDALDYFSYYC